MSRDPPAGPCRHCRQSAWQPAGESVLTYPQPAGDRILTYLLVPARPPVRTTYWKCSCGRLRAVVLPASNQ